MFELVLLASAFFQADALSDAARRAEQVGDFAAAERAYEQAVASTPRADLYQRLGLVRYMQNKYAEAIPAFQKALEIDAKLWPSHLFAGVSFYRTNQFEAALLSLQKAAALVEHNEVDFWLGATRIALKQYLPGLTTLERLRNRDPRNAELLRLLVQNYTDYGSALWSGIAEEHFDTPAGQQVHGRALELEGATKEALVAYNRALAMDPRRSGIHAAIGRVLLAQGKFAEALAACERELQLRPGHPEATYLSGVALLRMKRFDEARQRLESVAKWPEHAEEASELLRAIPSAVR